MEWAQGQGAPRRMNCRREEGPMSDVAQRLVATGKWSEESAWLSERAGHRCSVR